MPRLVLPNLPTKTPRCSGGRAKAGSLRTPEHWRSAAHVSPHCMYLSRGNVCSGVIETNFSMNPDMTHLNRTNRINRSEPTESEADQPNQSVPSNEPTEPHGFQLDFLGGSTTACGTPAPGGWMGRVSNEHG